ncbi:phytolongin Phyl2.1 isoform X2 [Physcomitrium patens]|uniref:Longin domain-containing protein n=2 Tax=Physcomitrium patens TaxID=3218 RepID=A0A2K1IUC9_PHYPA|nr:phytolongin Phyl2.1-like isoform X2 [Physcomitrium patens]PNR32868.1 hypothetical protein PHYPA_024811 [Physcomitrium patens]|eukprot:XP_024358132.1 phytolongin Phyl2.1-like isoform X2 [Physcomitrella patens]
MGLKTNLVYYASVSRDNVVLAEHQNSKEDPVTSEAAVGCLQQVPPYHNQFTYTIKQRMFIFLIDGAFKYCAIIDEALGKLKGLGFLEQVRIEFKRVLHSRNIDGYQLERNALVSDFSGVFKSLVRPLVGVPQKEVDLDDGNHHAISNDETVLSPSDSPRAERSNGDGVSPLTKSIHPKTDKKDHQVIQVKEIMMTKKNQKYEGDGTSSNMDLNNKKLRARELASKMWWRNVKFVLVLDLIVCCVLFAIWLGICRGFKCVHR